MALNFPSNPQIGDVYNYKGVSYKFSGIGWSPTSTPGTPNDAPVFVSDCPPHGARQGSLWYQASTGDLYLYYCDINGCQWVTTSPLPSDIITTAGGTFTGPVYLESPIDPNEPTQAINVCYVANVVRAGNGVTLNTGTNTVQSFDCGTFVP
jgi:hypothetical protein